MMRGKLDPNAVWQKLLRQDDPFSVFMAVPTVYSNLARHLLDGKLSASHSNDKVRDILSKYRLMVSGSAALPEPQMA